MTLLLAIGTPQYINTGISGGGGQHGRGKNRQGPGAAVGPQRGPGAEPLVGLRGQSPL
jgi:hypothetical protein